MPSLTEAQKKKLKAHSKTQTKTHMDKMVRLMKAGKSFSDAHRQVSKMSQKQKQSQSQKVIVNVGTIPRRRGRRPAAKPRVLSYQSDTARVLAQFAQPIGLPQTFNPPPTILPNIVPAPLVASPSNMRNETAPRPAPIVSGAVVGRAEMPSEPPMMEQARKATADARQFMRSNPIPREFSMGRNPPSTLSRNVSDTSTVPRSPYADPFAEDDRPTQEY